jgi:hypothetical protein
MPMFPRPRVDNLIFYADINFRLQIEVIDFFKKKSFFTAIGCFGFAPVLMTWAEKEPSSDTLGDRWSPQTNGLKPA